MSAEKHIWILLIAKVKIMDGWDSLWSLQNQSPASLDTKDHSMFTSEVGTLNL